MWSKTNKTFYLILLGLVLSLALGLRLFGLTNNPPALYWEEVALGYDAYSVLETGRDHHGNPWPVVAFESYGDWKPSLYFYAVMPFVWLFGLGSWAVRLPSVISGLVIVATTGMLFFQLQKSWSLRATKRSWWPVVAMALAAISPWAVTFSRAGWEVNLATALITLGVALGWQASLPKTKYRFAWMLSATLALTLSLYAYHATKLLAPFLGLGLFVLFIWRHFEEKAKTKRIVVEAAGVGLAALLLVAPIITQLGSSATTRRFAETNIFSQIEIIEASNQAKQAAGNTPFASLLYHRYFFFGQAILQNYLSHFELDFLIISGDNNPRHSLQYMGQLYHIEIIFLMIGVMYGFKHWNRYQAFLWSWLLIGIIPAAITEAAPHALRILPTLPVWLLLITQGLYSVVHELPAWLRQQVPSLKAYWPQLVMSLLVAFNLAQFLMFARYYFVLYPKLYAHEWQYGYQEMITQLATLQEQYQGERVFMTRDQGRPAMYYWFYTQTDPRDVQAQDEVVKQDEGEYLSFENVTFTKSVDEVNAFPSLVASSEEGYQRLQERFTTELLTSITDPRGQVVWVLYRVTP